MPVSAGLPTLLNRKENLDVIIMCGRFVRISTVQEIADMFSRKLDFHEVSTAVNSPRFNSEDCIEPLK